MCRKLTLWVDVTAFLYILLVCIFSMKSRTCRRDSLSDGKLRNLKVAKCRSGREVCRISIFFLSFFFLFGYCYEAITANLNFLIIS